MTQRRRQRGKQMTEMERLAPYFDLYDELGSGVLTAERCRAIRPLAEAYLRATDARTALDGEMCLLVEQLADQNPVLAHVALEVIDVASFVRFRAICLSDGVPVPAELPALPEPQGAQLREMTDRLYDIDQRERAADQALWAAVQDEARSGGAMLDALMDLLAFSSPTRYRLCELKAGKAGEVAFTEAETDVSDE